VLSPLAAATTVTVESVILDPLIKVEQSAVDPQIEPALLDSEAHVIIKKKVKRIISVEQYFKTKLVSTTKLTTDENKRTENGLLCEITRKNPPINYATNEVKWVFEQILLPEKDTKLAAGIKQDDAGRPRVLDPRRNGTVHICRDEKSLNKRCIYIPFNSRGNGVPTVMVEETVECVTPVTDGQEVYCLTPARDGQEDECVTPVTYIQEVQCVTPVTDGQEVYCVTPATDGQEDECVTPGTDGHEVQCVTPVTPDHKRQCVTPATDGQRVQCVTPVTDSQKVQRVTPVMNGQSAQYLTPVIFERQIAQCLASSPTCTR